MKLRAGLVGCGGIAKAHASGYKELGVEITAVTDQVPQAAEEMAKNFPGATTFPTFRELLESGTVDMISICTPPVAHEATAVHALSRNIHVLCEKPMAFDVPAAQRIEAAAKKSRSLFMPAFRHRFLPSNIAMRELLRSGKLGDIVFFNNIFCGPMFDMEHKWFTKRAIAGGGCLLDTNSHSVDLFRFLVGEISEQHACMHRHFKTTDVEDAGIITLKSETGAIGTVQSSFVAGKGCAFIDILCTKGHARYDYCDKPDAIEYRLTKDETWSPIPVQQSWGFTEEIAHFIGAIEGKHELSCTAHDGVRCMEVICANY